MAQRRWSFTRQGLEQQARTAQQLADVKKVVTYLTCDGEPEAYSYRHRL